MLNPFGTDPPSKPAKAPKPAPNNPFAPTNSSSTGAVPAGIAKPPKRNPFDPAQPAVAQVTSSTVPVAPLGGAPTSNAPVQSSPEDFVAPPPVPPPLPSEPIPEIVAEVVTTPTAPPPLPPSIPSGFPSEEEEFMSLPMPPPVPPPPVDDVLVVETPKYAPPPAAIPSQDDFDIAPSLPVSDPFDMPAIVPAVPVPVLSNDDFGFSVSAPVDDFDAFNSTKAAPVVPVAEVPVVEEIVPSLLPPPPQVDDDDPFDIHVNKPAFQPPPVIPSAPLAPVRRNNNAPPSAVATATKLSDPFLDLLPVDGKAQQRPHEAPAAAAAPKDPKDSLSLSTLMQQLQQSHQPVVANPFAPQVQPVVVAAPSAVPVKPQHRQQQQPAVVAPVPFIAANDDDFGLFGALPPVPHKEQVSSDPFAPSASAFAAPGKSVAVVDDFDVFGSSQSVPNLAPVKAAAPVDDFDIFASKAPASAPAIFTDDGFGSPATAAALREEEEDDPFDVFGLPNPKKQAAPAANSIFSPNPARQPSGGFDDEDPFAAAPGSTCTNLDAFSTDVDPLAALKAGYGLQSSAEIGEGGGGDDGFNDGFDDDFDFDNARHGTAGKGTASSHNTNRNHMKAAGSVLQNGLPAGAPGDDRVLDGDILSRLSTKAMFTKDWHDTYFVIKQGVLLLYRNRLDYQYNPNGTNYKKKFPITYNMRLLQIKGKEYKGLGTVYNFVLEELLDYGPATLGKFGATEKETVQRLWKYIRDLIMFKRRDRQRGKPHYGR